MIRKPNRRLFEIALIKAGLEPGEVWFCGDSFAADVMGAHGAGIFPVLYEGFAESSAPDPGFPMLLTKSFINADGRKFAWTQPTPPATPRRVAPLAPSALALAP